MKWYEFLIPVLATVLISSVAFIFSEVADLQRRQDLGEVYIGQLKQLRKEADDFEHRLRTLEKELK